MTPNITIKNLRGLKFNLEFATTLDVVDFEGQRFVIKKLTFKSIVSCDGDFMPISDRLQIETLLTLGFPVLWLLELPPALRRQDCFH